MGSALTIIMIAHRLSTIATADHLAFIKDNKTVIEASKGTNEYDELFESLKDHNYKHQLDVVE
jgi:ABC-type multidrug transport system fused ATPase/permease subunit